MSNEEIEIVDEIHHAKDNSEVEFLGSHQNDCIIVYEKTTTNQTNKRRKTSNKRKRTSTPNKRPKTQPESTPASSPSNLTLRLSCCICLDTSESNDKFFSTTCGHIYCESCIDKIMKIPKQANCAICRKKLTKRQYHRIFLN